MMKLDIKNQQDICIITPGTTRLDASTAVDFKTALLNLIKENNIRILLNLEQIEFIDSSGLGAIISALRQVGVKGDIKLCNVNKQIMELLRLTRLDKILDSFENEKTALEGF
ncbi:anti-sigma B factor antagonist [Maridesulfovibrio ferrireducens]|uniref:Anti-sigma factor antagonist n=1 Tax=Maridesulfovibrio ferrireducens TaxID=246191 RepID=A0A1G9EWA7_9BACT|nr:STAS domain-containing protein [Maridesulfovibrio ferrireducens]SDK80328.1 anti-sigma B factor antagonist [Maridesulfovibrio ferrireducens]